MKFAVGYQLPDEDGSSTLDLVRDFRDHIAEVYFPWSDQPSGRAPLTARRGYVDWMAQRQLEEELKAFRDLGVRLDILFNANCYGMHASSQYLENQITSVLDHLEEVAGGADTVTTTSPAIAHIVKKHFPHIERRASVNMRIGTVQGMSAVSELFDGYYVQRDLNRDLAALRDLRAWAEGAGKRLYLLVNSGCLRYCPGQTFHDNMVAHEREIDEIRNMQDWAPHVCWNLLRNREHWAAVLQSTWIRPEDLHHYDDLFPLGKLATRMHARPRAVLRAYTERKYRGNLLDLFEPGFAPAFAPNVIDNGKFPEDWFERTSQCGGRCHHCDYCQTVLDTVLTRFDDNGIVF